MSYLLVQSDARRIPLPDNSVHMCVTSPPYFALRDYGTGRWEGGDAACSHVDDVASETKNRLAGSHSGHIANRTSVVQSSFERATVQYRDACGKCGARRVDRQLGLEQSPEAYVAAMVAVFREVKRVLHPSGTAWVNIGDSYVSNGRGWGGDHNKGNAGGFFETDVDPRRIPGLKPKDLLGIPWALAFALRADGWYLRSEIIWAKPNPMPESVTDRPTKSHEQVFLLSKRENYYFDSESVREKAEYGRREWSKEQFKCGDITVGHGKNGGSVTGGDPSTGRNLRSVWTIPSESYPGSHYATFPRKLVEPCIKAGSSERGCCPRCKAPWTREIEATKYEPEVVSVGVRNVDSSRGDKVRKLSGKDYNNQVQRSTLGWAPSCSCPDHTPEPCIVLDPFAGSGTSLVVALALGRRAIGLDLSREYLTRDAQRRINRPHARAIRPAREEVHPLFPDD